MLLISVRPVEGLTELDMKLDLEIVWRKDNDNPCLPHFTKNYNPQMTRLT